MDSDQKIVHSNLHDEYEAWRKTGHDITYQQWLEITLDVERTNHRWMVEQWQQWQKKIMWQILDLTNISRFPAAEFGEKGYLGLIHIARLVRPYCQFENGKVVDVPPMGKTTE